jgi:hypothetical protein
MRGGSTLALVGREFMSAASHIDAPEMSVPSQRALPGGGAAELLREAEPVRDSLLQSAQKPVSDRVMLVVKQSARLR